MVQSISLSYKGNSRQIKIPAGQERVHSRVRAQLDHGGATHRRGYTNQIAKAPGESDVFHIAGGQGLSLENRSHRGARAVSHYRLLPEHDCGKKFLVACGVPIVRRGGGSTTNVVALLLSERRPGDVGGSMPEQNEIYKVDCLDLREARHKHGGSTVWDRS